MPETTILKWEIDTASAEKNVDELTLSIDKNTKKLKGNKKQVTVLEKENKKLSNSLKGNTKDRKVAQQQIIKNTTQIKSLTIANAKQRDGITELNSKRRQEVKVSKVQAGSLNALRSNVSKLIKVRNNLNITTKKGRREFESMNKVILRQNNLIKRAEERGGDFRRSVGNYGKALGVVKGKLLGAIGGFFLLVKGIKDAIVTIRDFEKAMDKVQAITGATSDEINLLREDAIRLGGSTSKTATQVAELQTEFAKLGFSTQEILSATEATISLSIAAGTDLAQAATVAGATVRGFGLEADETQRIVDVMALSFSSSALDINKFQTAMGVVAPVAKSAGVSVEETTAILAQFVDAGLDASTAGTGLRNIFLELSKQGITLEEALEKIRTSSDANKTALELFGKRGATVGIIMANTADSADLLQKSLENAGGSAQEMANIMEDNLSGDVAKAGSAWEGLILSLDSGAGALTSIFRGVIQGVTSVLGFFIDANKTLIEEWEDQDKVVKQLEVDIDPLLTACSDRPE